MSDTTGWKRVQYGTWYKEIGNHAFRLWRNPKGWRITYESLLSPTEEKLEDAKRLAHRIARKLDTP